MPAPARKPKPQRIMEVLSTERIAPHLMRVWVGGPAMAEFTDNDKTDHYIKIWFAKPELGLSAPYDVESLREKLDPEDLPVTRTYTIAVLETGRFAVDFVVHGDEGIAGPWAVRAQPGEQIVFSGPGGAYAPDPSADSHLLAGDESAIPAIASALSHLAEHVPNAVGAAYLEVGGPDDELRLKAPEGIAVHWLHRGDAPAGTSRVLSEAVAAHRIQDRVQVFAHGERECMKAIRDVLKPHNIPRSDLSLTGYWAYGRSEDRFQAEKRDPIGVIL